MSLCKRSRGGCRRKVAKCWLLAPPRKPQRKPISTHIRVLFWIQNIDLDRVERCAQQHSSSSVFTTGPNRAPSVRGKNLGEQVVFSLSLFPPKSGPFLSHTRGCVSV